MPIRYLPILVALFALAGCAGHQRHAPQPIYAHHGSLAPRPATTSDVQVNLLAMGDWGTGGDKQRRIALAMGDYIGRSGTTFDGILLAGDNFYVKLRGIDDPLWQTAFEQMYEPSRFAFPFFASFGNHDYENGKDLIQLAYAQAHPESRWKMPARWYRVDLPQGDEPLVTVLMLDSNKGLLGESQWHEELDWLQQELSRPRRARWLVVCAHHPLFSNGDHGDNGVLQRDWGPLFQQYNVDFYLCGHDHDLQHLQPPGRSTTFLLVGGGGAGIRPMRFDGRGPFSRSSHGFAHLEFTEDRAIVRLLDGAAEVVHTAVRDPGGGVTIIKSTGSDVAIPRTVRSITRPDATTAPQSAAQD